MNLRVKNSTTVLTVENGQVTQESHLRVVHVPREQENCKIYTKVASAYLSDMEASQFKALLALLPYVTMPMTASFHRTNTVWSLKSMNPHCQS